MVLSPVYLRRINTNMDSNPTDKYNGFIDSMDIWIEYEKSGKESVRKKWKPHQTVTCTNLCIIYYMCTLLRWKRGDARWTFWQNSLFVGFYLSVQKNLIAISFGRRSKWWMWKSGKLNETHTNQYKGKCLNAIPSDCSCGLNHQSINLRINSW